MGLKIRPIVGRPIPIGRQGEHLARRIDFTDQVDFMREVYGEGRAELRYQRPEESSAYVPAYVDTTAGLVWSPTATDTENAGNGKLELRWYVDDRLAKSRVWAVVVEESLFVDGESPEDHDYYTGPYEVTPSDEEQTLETADLIATDNVVVKPIPSNYGHISYSGYDLRVY